MALETGGFYFLTGASGVGKTTLLNIICLAEQPSSGRVMLLGRDAAGLSRAARGVYRRRVGIVFQDFRLIGDLSAGENVALPLRIKGAPEKQIRENVPELLSWVGLAARSDAPVRTLSGGEQQRIAIARAVVGRPDLLIADEPTGNVDDDVAMLLVRVFERINRLGTTVLIATHDIAFARQFEHQRFHLEGGGLTLVPGALVE
ncbi:MAG: ATP-binding cassette domain-containing protein [Alphaproteobacteria bacterium]|nr:ATP-binding cassette domain-containing protein [Alphaproteobacteria bacterium]